MTGTELALVITAATTGIATLLTSIGAFVAILRKVSEQSTKVEETLVKVEAVHVATNSMKDQLVAATAAAEHAKGKSEGKAEAKAEQGAAALAVKEDKEKA